MPSSHNNDVLLLPGNPGIRDLLAVLPDPRVSVGVEDPVVLVHAQVLGLAAAAADLVVLKGTAETIEVIVKAVFKILMRMRNSNRSKKSWVGNPHSLQIAIHLFHKVARCLYRTVL